MCVGGPTRDAYSLNLYICIYVFYTLRLNLTVTSNVFLSQVLHLHIRISGAGYHDTLGTCFGEIGHGFVVSLPFILSIAACILNILLTKPYTDDSKKKRILFIIVILFIAGKNTTQNAFHE